MTRPFQARKSEITGNEAADYVAIEQVLMRYARGVDRGDKELLKSVYHEGGTDDHGSFVGLGVDFADYIVDVMNAVGGTGQHHITNVLIELCSESTAHVESYYLAMHPYPGPDGVPVLAFVGGRYMDKFEKREGRWGIIARKVTFDWTREELAGAQWSRAAGFTGGDRDPKDASYAWF
ncbi:MAG: nuclear transport factor 2 family protein [Actinomycetes bacterium]